MGQSTDAQICFGVSLDEDFEAPWDKEKYDYDIGFWWIYKIKGYEDPVQIYNEAGEYINELPPSKEDKDRYYDTRKKFEKDNPVPVEPVYHCSSNHTMWIIAVPATVITANRGYPTRLTSLTDLRRWVSEILHKKLVDFCQLVNIDMNNKNTGWWLSSWRG